jgi:hypothetical protein
MVLNDFFIQYWYWQRALGCFDRLEVIFVKPHNSEVLQNHKVQWHSC